MSAAPHLLHVFSTFVPAGPEMRTVRLIGALGDAFRHSILAIDGRTDAAEYLSPEVDARVLESLPRAGTPRTVLALRRLFAREAPDLILTYNWGAFDAVIAARTGGRPVLHHEDGFNLDEARTFKGRRELARRLLLPGVRRVVVPSGVLRGVALERWRLRPDQVALVPNGIRLEDFAPEGDGERIRSQLGIPNDALVVGYVGHLRPVKNPRRCLEAVAQVRAEQSVHVLMLGEGPERDGVEQLARSPALDGRVHLTGHRADPRPDYHAMDLFAISSDSEQMPVALLEAMASGLPVVATDVGDVREMLPPEQGDLVVAGDPAEAVAGLAEGIGRLAGDPDRRARLGAANRARVAERYTFARMLSSYRDLYRSALSS